MIFLIIKDVCESYRDSFRDSYREAVRHDSYHNKWARSLIRFKSC